MTTGDAQPDGVFRPGQVWHDTDGQPIQAHGGGILYDGGTYYWYGEDRSDSPRPGRAIGVSCYSSQDLYHWRCRGVVLSMAPDDPGHDVYPPNVLERPKVVCNRRTGKYVMWLHVDSPDYKAAGAGLATAETPTGPFCYIGSVRPHSQDSRDQTVFVDDDGRAFRLYASEGNQTMYVSLLSDDYLEHTGACERILVGRATEAPAVFKRDGQYYLIGSGCSGWDPNPARLAASESIWGPWQELGNPCLGPNADVTFHSQSTFVLPVAGRKDAFIFMADRWQAGNLGDSRYVWLPLRFRVGKPTLEWRDTWDLSIFDG